MSTTDLPTIDVHTFTVGSTAYPFVRRVSGEVEGWFTAEIGYTKESVLRNAAGVGRVVLDIGSYTYPPLVLLAEFDSAADRTAFKALIGYPGTLANTLGRSASALLVRCREPEQGDGRFLLECTFEKYD